jgi:hypothetical protein
LQEKRCRDKRSGWEKTRFLFGKWPPSFQRNSLVTTPEAVGGVNSKKCGIVMAGLVRCKNENTKPVLAGK